MSRPSSSGTEDWRALVSSSTSSWDEEDDDSPQAIIQHAVRDCLRAVDLNVVTTKEIHSMLRTKLDNAVDIVALRDTIDEELFRYIGQQDEATEVIPHLYLGSRYNACDKKFFQSKHICAVVNVTKEVPNYFEERVKYFRCRIEDEPGEPISNYFAETSVFIEEALSAGKGVLVHCHEGISRSSTIVCAFLMWQQGIGLRSALDTIIAKRDVAQPNPGFLGQLRRFEAFSKLTKL